MKQTDILNEKLIDCTQIIMVIVYVQVNNIEPVLMEIQLNGK